MRRASGRAPGAVVLWEAETYPEVRGEAASRGAEIHFWDGAAYRLDDQVGRTWRGRGQTPVVEATGKRARINCVVAMSPAGAFWHGEFKGNLNGESFCELPDRFMRTRRRPVTTVMDSCPAHVCGKGF